MHLCKSVCIFLVCGILFGKSFGQTSLLEKTSEYLKAGKIAEAQDAINLAVTNEETKNIARTWYLKGFVYKELYKQTPTITDNREIAIECLHNAQTLDTKNTYTTSVTTALDYLYGSYYNESIDLLNSKQYEKALKGLEKFIAYREKTKPDNFYAEALYYAGYVSYTLTNKTDAKKYYEKALEKGYKNPLLYDDLLQLYLSENNKPKAIQIIETGRKIYPDDANLRTAEINMYLQLKEYTQAEKRIDDYLKIKPSDVEAMMVAGTVYEAIARKDTGKQEAYFHKRKELYRKILIKEPDNFLANYNLGIVYYNRAVELINQHEALDESITQFSQRLEVISGLIVESKPYVEKAARLSPQSLNSLKALSGIYHYLDEREKFVQVQQKIKLIEKK